jgi:hypothetical protein
MKQVEESLKSARLIHRFLMLLCASVLAAALYPPEEKDYSGAIAEIDTIVKIDLDGFVNNSLRHVKSLAKGMDLVDAYQRAFNSAIRRELKKEGFVFPSIQPLNHEVFLPAFDEDFVRSLLHSGTIEDYRDFIAENMGIEYVFVQPEFLATAFVKKIRELYIPPENKIIGTQLIMPRPLYRKHEPKYLNMTLILAVLMPNSNIGSYLVVVEDPPVSLTSTFNETRFQDWLDKQQLLERLVGHRMPDSRYHTAESIFPQLRSVWSLVEDKVPEEAKRVLLVEAEKSLRTISFFNVEIPASMVVLAGPLLAVMLLLYLLSHVGHLQRICHTDTDLFCMFPWLPLFPDRISLTVFFISILLLPLIAFGCLLVRFWHVGAIIMCVAIPLTLVSIVLAYLSWRRILALRRPYEEEKEGRSGK